MKALIVECLENSKIVLTSDGVFKTVENGNASLSVGDYLELPGPVTAPKRKPFRKMALVAASLVICLSTALGVYGYTAPCGIVSLEINPSYQVTYNWFKKALKVQGLNEDALNVLATHTIPTGSDIDDTVCNLISASMENQDNSQTKPSIIITVSDKNSDNRRQSVSQSIWETVNSKKHQAEVYVLSGDVDTYKNLKDHPHGPSQEIIEKHSQKQDLKNIIQFSTGTEQELTKEKQHSPAQENKNTSPHQGGNTENNQPEHPSIQVPSNNANPAAPGQNKDTPKGNGNTQTESQPNTEPSHNQNNNNNNGQSKKENTTIDTTTPTDDSVDDSVDDSIDNGNSENNITENPNKEKGDDASEDKGNSNSNKDSKSNSDSKPGKKKQ